MRTAYVVIHPVEGVFVHYYNSQVMFCTDYTKWDKPVSSFSSPQSAIEHMTKYWDAIASGKDSIKKFTFYPVRASSAAPVNSQDLAAAGVPIARR